MVMDWMSSTVPHIMAAECEFNAGGLCTLTKPNTYIACFGVCESFKVKEKSEG